MKPVVSVAMITYNHEKFIKDAIDGVLKQKVDFCYEIVIGEDCSKDKTKSIIKAYEKKYKNLFVVNYENKNIGMVPNFVKTIKSCKGKYVAILEGDDYWIDKNKLQKQVDYLENHPDCNITSHNVFVTNGVNNTKYLEWLGKDHRSISYLNDLLREGSGGATCSLMVRKKIFQKLPKWFGKLPSVDWATQVLAADNSYMYYFAESMGVYRKHVNSATDFKNDNQKLLSAFLNGGILLCETFNKHFNYVYEKEIQEHLVNYMYPNLVRIYYKLHDFINASKYVFLILNKSTPDTFTLLFYLKIIILGKISNLINLINEK